MIERRTALLLLALLAASPAAAQQRLAPDGAFAPDANAVHEGALLHQEPRILGRIDIPATRADVLIQPAGRQWDFFHEVVLHWYGAVILLGTVALLVAGYVLLGPLRLEAGRSGRRLVRFGSFERFAHWLNAVSFVALALTGLNMTFGKDLLRPLIGPDAFAEVAQWAKYVHNFASTGFVLGMVLICVLWLRDNMPARVDFEWLKQGGGFIKGKPVHAGRFNAGEKMVFWLSMAAAIAVIVTGYTLLFPFYFLDIFGMQLAQGLHALVAVLFMAIIAGHIYIGTLGTEGAFEAMGRGSVDLNWAREHHDLWAEEQLTQERIRTE
ncbi:MAG TPA: formate dehydrogenase subunit gamma [Acetobacteraceae bacterium]|nr:formate dehydrogenase subunit gamma [Acetobacteraceae bacterium]